MLDTRAPSKKVNEIAKNIFDDMGVFGKDKMAIMVNYFLQPGKIFIAGQTVKNKIMVGIWEININDDSIKFLGKFNPKKTLSKNKTLLKRYGKKPLADKYKPNN